MRRRGSASIVANPVLVGAVTTLVVIVAVFLAYNANNGLPFVPTRQLKIDIPNGSELVKGNEVRVGGYRVGVVNNMAPVRMRDGRVGAELTLKLDERVGDLPVDSLAVIRPRSALGLKFVEIDRGTSKRTIPDGGTLPTSQTRLPVDLDQVYSTFDGPTRRASTANLDGFGDTFVGRGPALNEFIQTAPALFGVLAPVAHNLADPRTQLGQFFEALDRTARVVAPVSQTNAHLFTTMADTFNAISRDPQALRDTISKSPPTLDVAIHSLHAQRPFLRDTAAFSRDLGAAANDLKPSLPVINSALETGPPVLRRSVQLQARLQDTLRALNELASEPSTNAALRGLTATVTTLQPQLRYLGPYVTTCNSWNFFWTLAAEHLSSPVPTGTAQRAMLNMAAPQTDGIGAMGATRPANGEGSLPGQVKQYLHGNFYSHAVATTGAANCEAGQQGYINGTNSQHTANPFGPKNESRVVLDASHNIVAQGPTYKQLDRNGRGVGLNPDRVPNGETYTIEPGGTGATLAVP